MPPKRKSYSTDYKLQVIKYAAKNGNRASERKFGMSEKLVREWRKAEATLTAMKKTKNRGLKVRLPEQRLHRSATEQRAAGTCLSTVEELCLQALNNKVSQPMDLIHKQACIDLEKATQCITQALQHEAGRNQELCMLIRHLEEKEAETGRSLTEQVESNKQLKLKIDELYKHLWEKDHSLTQANQTVTFLKNELRDLNLNQNLQSQPSIRTGQDGNEWLQSGETQIRQINSPSSPLQPDQLMSEGQIPLMSPDGWTPLEAPVLGIKEEHSERDDPRLEYTAAEGTDIKLEQIQTPLVSSDGQRLLEAPVSEDEDGEDEHGECSHSGKGSFPSRSNSRTQMKKRTRYYCSQCGKTFRVLSALQQHQKTHKEQSPSYYCFPSPANSHTQMKNRTHYYCSECGKTFRVLSALQQHQKTHKEESPSYYCSPCGKSFVSDKYLRVHQLAVHSRKGKRPHQFTRHLEDHKRFHTGNRPYSCTQCGKSFIHNASLKRHQRTHTGEKPYHCSQCGKSFTLKETLTLHQLTHTGEKPFQCTQCGKSFSLKGNLKTHQRIHTMYLMWEGLLSNE